MIWLIVYGISYLCTFVVCFGLFFAEAQRAFPMIAAKDYRKDIGMSVFISMLYAILGPLGLIIALCMTGFAEHGLKYR